MEEHLQGSHYHEFDCGEHNEQGAAAIGLYIKKEHIVLLQAIVESYDHLGLVRTLPARPELPTRIVVLSTSHRAPVLLELLESIRNEIPWNPAGIEDVEVGVLFGYEEFP